MKLEIPILVLDPALDPPRVVEKVEVDVECFTGDRESLKCARLMLKEDWSWESVCRITLWGLGRKLEVTPQR